MDIGAIGNLASSMAAASTSEAVSVAVLKTALNAQTQTASALIDALPSSTNLPAHLGQNINTTA